jgi:transcriptional regulator with XRE-family HTH domain
MSDTKASTRGRLREHAAEELRVILARRRMSAAELARRTGIKQSTMARRMTGETAFDLDDLELIAEALGIEIADLFPPSGGATTTRSVSDDLNRALARSRKDDPKPVRHVATRPFSPPRRDPNGPPSATPLSSRRPRDTRPVKRPMAVAS